MEILFSDKHVVVAVKPRGVLSEHSEVEQCMPTLLAPYGKLFPVHRLDRAVGGVMVYARTKRAAAALCEAILQGALKKEYTAIVSGESLPAAGEMKDLLFKDSSKNKSFVVDRPRAGAKEARLTYCVKAHCVHEGAPLSLVRILLDTGRSHQIRVQFSSRTHPLVGDGKYGSRIKAKYPALYATSLSFPHPVSGEIMQFSTSVPRDFPWDLFSTEKPEIERKYLIEYPDEQLLAAQPGCVIKQIVQTYLLCDKGETRRVRRAESAGEIVYTETRKRRVSDIQAMEDERTVTGEEYDALLKDADPDCRPIRKTRYCIPYKGRIAEVDVYEFWRDRATLEVELESEQECPVLPPYIKVIREVSADVRYKNARLARELPE
jgi:23S rRNA pseudouridine1911/1915/1917 synthase